MKKINNMTIEERDIFVKDLWENFSNIIIDEEEKTEENFYIWNKGTDINEIWNWFDENYSKGLATGLMGLE